MTDRDLEARLRALYRGRVPAEDMAPIDLRSSLVAITRSPSRPAHFGGSRAWALLAAAALLGAMLIGGALVAGSDLLRSIALVPPSDSPAITGTPAPTGEVGPVRILPWPDMGPNNPAGLYAWNVGGRSWMHKVPDEPSGKADSVELSFRLTTQPYELKALADALTAYGDGPIPGHPIEIPALAVEIWVDESGASGVNGVAVEPGATGAALFKATQTWLMDIDGRVVAIDVTTYKDTTLALLAEAIAAIRSVRPQRRDPAATPAPSGYPPTFPGIIFELTGGWDTG